MVKKEYYKILEVSTDASCEDVKAGYSKLSLEKHPDKGGSKEEFEKIIEAYEILSNPHQRLKYDLGLLRKHFQYIEPEGKETIYNLDEEAEDELV
jgi:DnaJ-class molecular chaperone